MSTNIQLFRRILARNVLLPLVLGIVSCGIFAAMITYLMSANRWVEHTDQVLNQIEVTQKRILDAETGLRGFLLSQKESYLDPYHATVKTWKNDRDALRALVSDNQLEVQRVDDVSRDFENWLSYSDKQIAAAEREKSALVVRQMEDHRDLMSSIRDNFHDMVSTEVELREKRSADAHAFVGNFLWIMIGFILLSSAMLALWGRRQLMQLSEAYEEMLREKETQNEILTREQWMKENAVRLNDRLLGRRSLNDLCEQILLFLTELTGAEAGLIYVTDDHTSYYRLGALGVPKEEGATRMSFTVDETLLGRAVKAKKATLYSDLPEKYMTIASGLGTTNPKHVVIAPVASEGEVNAVIELGFLQPVSKRTLEFLDGVVEKISVAVQSVKYRERLENLLHEVQVQSEELQAQQEELRVSNEELDNQAKLLKEAQSRTEAQNAELEQTNEQLTTQAKILEEQKDQIDRHNRELMITQEEIQRKAEELEQASRYKSEFLANMSHELRTPLNSSLILAQLLTENREGNLSEKQVNFARQIVKSGNDLLLLINDILDLSKVESGKLDILPEDFALGPMVSELEKTFSLLAQEKGIDFRVSCERPEYLLHTDRLRLEQILKNLISNALKFTPKGFVELQVRVSEAADRRQSRLSFAVRDSGIGIKESQKGLIFEAFKQADGTTSRQFGGTGLGLSISQNLAKMLGGRIDVESELNRGSTFTLQIPGFYQKRGEKIPEAPGLPSPSRSVAPPAIKEPEAKAGPLQREKPFIEDDRAHLRPDSKVILIVEDDASFAAILRDMTREMGFKALNTDTAEEALALAEQHHPLAVILDILLPDHSGLFVLDQMKQRSQTRHIPVHIISAENFATQAYGLGAVGYMLKPVKREQLTSALEKLAVKAQKAIKKVLIVEDDEAQSQAISHLIGGANVEIFTAKRGDEALKRIRETNLDCIILDLSLPDMSGLSLLEKLAAEKNEHYPPVIVYTGRDLSKEEEIKIRQFSQSVIIKGVKSPERLLDQVTLFLHQVESKLPMDQQKILSKVRNRDQAIENKSVLVVDDDLRNVFALTAALEQRGAKVSMAKDGKEALERLRADGKYDVVLMDIMMPVMDGYEAIHALRQDPRLKKLPVIALTAKAMRDDREKVLKAGADDYMAKPVDIDKLLSLIRVWTADV